MEEGYDINLVTPLASTSQSIILLQVASNKPIKLETPEVYVNHILNVDGLIIGSNISVKSPLCLSKFLQQIEI